MRDGVALLAILARVRRRLRALAALESGVTAGALVLAALAIAIGVARWRLGALPHWATTARLVIAALVAVGAGALAGAARRISLARCARIVDRTLGGHDRVLSALAFWRAAGDGATQLTPFVTAAIADAVTRGAACALGAVAPLRRPRAVPALAIAALLVGASALVPVPARGSRTPVGLPIASDGARTNAARVHLSGAALDPERDQIAEALRTADALSDPELAALAHELAAVVNDLAGQGLERGAALDRLADLQRRSAQAAAELAALRQAMEQAGQVLQGTAATKESGRALEAADGARTEKALDDLAALAAAAGAEERDHIASALEKAGDRALATAGNLSPDGRPSSTTPAANTPSGAAHEDSASLTPSQEPRAPDEAAAQEQQRRLARDAPNNARNAGDGVSVPRPSGARRLERLDRELRDAATGCRSDPETCRRKLKHQSQQLPRMEDEVRSLAQRQRLSDAVRQLRERLRREANNGGERAREERRFLRAARGDGSKEQSRRASKNGDGEESVAVGDEDGDGISDEGDDRDQDSDSDGEGGASAEGASASSGSEQGGASASADGEEGGPGAGIGNQKGNAPLGEQGSMTTRGRAREASVRNGAGPTRAQVIQSAAQRGFARTPYQNVYADYQSAVEESLDASAVPPGRRYIVRRYFQLIRPQSTRPSPSPTTR